MRLKYGKRVAENKMEKNKSLKECPKSLLPIKRWFLDWKSDFSFFQSVLFGFKSKNLLNRKFMISFYV